jgi:hypothetical protein
MVKQLLVVTKFVEMVLNINNNVMMEIQITETDVIINVNKNLDGFVVEVHLDKLVFVKNLFQIKFNYHRRELLI